MQEDKNYCVYLHRRCDNNEIIYIGEGRERRARIVCKSHARNKEYAKILELTKIYYEIYKNGLTKQQAVEEESSLIVKLKSENHPITNKLKSATTAKELNKETYDTLFCVDPTSPSGLRWKIDKELKGSGNSSPRFKGDIAGVYNTKEGYWYLKGRACHRIVYALVHGVCPANLTVDHIDGNKANNAITNLQLLTVSENVAKSHNNGIRQYSNGTTVGGRKLSIEDVTDIYEMFRKLRTDKEIAVVYNINRKFVSELRHGRKWKALFSKLNEKFPTLTDANNRLKEP